MYNMDLRIVPSILHSSATRDPVAQWQECLTSIQKVLGSNPSWVLIFFRTPSAAQRDVEKQFVICLS